MDEDWGGSDEDDAEYDVVDVSADTLLGLVPSPDESVVLFHPSGRKVLGGLRRAAESQAYPELPMLTRK